MYIYEVQCDCVIRDLDGSLPLRLGYKKSVDVVLYPKLCTDSWFSLTFSKRIPEGLCNLFQVNDLTFGRNASEEESGHFLCFPSSCVLVCCGILGGFLFAFFSGCMVKFSTFSNQFLTSLAYYSVGSLCQFIHYVRAHLKCCYLTWQEQDCWQSPETTLCQRNTNRL